MKKYFVLCAGLCAAMAFTSCKSSESAYKKAYEKAKAQETQPVQQAPAEETPVNVVAPVETKPANETRVVDNMDNVQVRQESVSLISGSGLKNFSVVVGSFSVRANAEGPSGSLRRNAVARLRQLQAATSSVLNIQTPGCSQNNHC